MPSDRFQVDRKSQSVNLPQRFLKDAVSNVSSTTGFGVIHWGSHRNRLEE